MDYSVLALFYSVVITGYNENFKFDNGKHKECKQNLVIGQLAVFYTTFTLFKDSTFGQLAVFCTTFTLFKDSTEKNLL